MMILVWINIWFSNGVSSILVLPHLSVLVVVTITTQNKDFIKGHIEVYHALVDELLHFYQLKWNSNQFDMFYLNAQKLPGFSMHEMQCTHLFPLFYNL
jgi:hypothetical protein